MLRHTLWPVRWGAHVMSVAGGGLLYWSGISGFGGEEGTGGVGSLGIEVGFDG